MTNINDFPLIEVVDIHQLKYLYDCSAMTWEGLREEDFGLAMKECGMEDAKGWITKGATMNRLCGLTGSNAYPDDLNIFSIDRFRGLAMTVGARWMDDIIDNNARREDSHPFDNWEEETEDEEEFDPYNYC